MKRIVHTALAASFLLSSFAPAMAQSDDHRDEHRREEPRREEQRREAQPQRRYQETQEHGGYRRGEAMRREDWDHCRRFDYHEYGLYEPPYGYEWREVGGVFILGAIATGIIANILLQPR